VKNRGKWVRKLKMLVANENLEMSRKNRKWVGNFQYISTPISYPNPAFPTHFLFLVRCVNQYYNFSVLTFWHSAQGFILHLHEKFSFRACPSSEQISKVFVKSTQHYRNVPIFLYLCLIANSYCVEPTRILITSHNYI
jgi:hypothetical protein